jgi:hypothetical protein
VHVARDRRDVARLVVGEPGRGGPGQPVTATEVDSRDHRSMVTREKRADHWRYGLAESEQATATTLYLLNRAGAVSTLTKVKILHPGWDDAAIVAEVSAIFAETGAAPDPVGTSSLVPPA